MSAAAVIDRLETGLHLEPQHAHIARRLATYDPELRLRRSAEPERRRMGCGHILERRSLNAQPAGSEKDADYRIAARDGYVIVSPVHVSYLMREEAIVEALIDGDMARQTAGERFQRIVNAADDEKAARRKARLDDFRHHYAESFDVLDRLGDATGKFEKTRINNAGVPEAITVTDRRRFTPEGFAIGTSAGESPAQESSDVHPPHATDRRQDGVVHHSA